MAGVTQINADYLYELKQIIQDVDDNVEALLAGHGPSNDPGATSYIYPLNQMSLIAGPSGFQAGTAVDTAVNQAGTSVYEQLEWLDKLLKDMIEDINNTVSGFKGTEAFNNESVDTLLTNFQNTISDMGTPPGGGSGSSSSTSGSSTSAGI
jgi:hypothetical protein